MKFSEFWGQGGRCERIIERWAAFASTPTVRMAALQPPGGNSVEAALAEISRIFSLHSACSQLLAVPPTASADAPETLRRLACWEEFSLCMPSLLSNGIGLDSIRVCIYIAFLPCTLGHRAVFRPQQVILSRFLPHREELLSLREFLASTSLFDSETSSRIDVLDRLGTVETRSEFWRVSGSSGGPLGQPAQPCRQLLFNSVVNYQGGPAAALEERCVPSTIDQ